MERVEMVGGSIFVLKTRQVGPSCWCCDVYERIDNVAAESFMFEDSARARPKRSRWRCTTRTSPTTSSLTIADSRDPRAAQKLDLSAAA